MAAVRFPGHEKARLFGDTGDLMELLKFFLKISSLTRLKRTGWVRCGVNGPETVAAHMYRMALMGLLVSCQNS